MTAAFDTLTAARRMEDAGMKREQAVAESVRAAAGADREELATKADLAAVKAELKADLAEFRAEFKADLAVLKADFEGKLESGLATLRAEFMDRLQSTERRMYAAFFGVGGLLFAALKLVP